MKDYQFSSHDSQHNLTVNKPVLLSSGEILLIAPCITELTEANYKILPLRELLQSEHCFTHPPVINCIQLTTVKSQHTYLRYSHSYLLQVFRDVSNLIQVQNIPDHDQLI